VSDDGIQVGFRHD